MLSRPLPALLSLVLGTFSMAFLARTVLESESLVLPFVSAGTWEILVDHLGSRLDPQPHPWLGRTAGVSGLRVGLWVGLFAAVAWLAGAWQLARRGREFRRAMFEWAARGWRWGLLALIWPLLIDAALIAGWPNLFVWAAKMTPLWITLILNLWGAEYFRLRRESSPQSSHNTVEPVSPGSNLPARERRLLLAAVSLYVVTFTAMNWGLWFNLQLPHGDSAMYEEHLWNLEHGKGFRSYLDQGLFLGEHLQVIHALLIPLHVVWPSHLLMELCGSLALGLTAIPLYFITRRHTGSDRAALFLAVAGLLYFPLQTLDIEIDFKTFRPTALAVPVMLAAIDQMERRRFKTMLLLLLVTLSAQEDHAIPVALLGFWLLLTGDSLTGNSTASQSSRRVRWLGTVIFIVSVAYLLFAVRVAIPWFRGGALPHFARYFSAFGETPLEIARNMLTNPGLLLRELFDAPTVMYAAYLLVPLGLLPLFSPARLALGFPLFLLLCLNEVGQDPPGPFHHFHSPLVPLLLWAAAAGAGNVSRLRGRIFPISSETAARFACGCALVSGTCYTLSPLGTRFWDPHRVVAQRPTYWRSLYVPNERAKRWTGIELLIPQDARVASTDFVHPRLTHRERSYDYSKYPRQVAGYEDRVPSDTDYIVLDLQHPYSESVLGAVRSAADVRELQEHPERWELLTDESDRFFVVLKRRESQ